MQQQLQSYIDSFILGVLSEPRIASLPEDEQSKLRSQFQDRFDELILDTLLNRLNDDQVKELQGKLTDPTALEEKIAEYSALVPGLAEDLQHRLDREFTFIKSSL